VGGVNFTGFLLKLTPFKQYIDHTKTCLFVLLKEAVMLGKPVNLTTIRRNELSISGPR
jgi:hypothetical protein